MGPGACRVDVGPEFKLDRPPVESVDGRSEVVHRSAVVDRDPGSVVGEESRHRDSAAGQTEHRDRPPFERAVAGGCRGQAIEVDDASCHGFGYTFGIEATKSVTPSRPASAPTIQNRIVTFSSSQPPSSKWW